MASCSVGYPAFGCTGSNVNETNHRRTLNSVRLAMKHSTLHTRMIRLRVTRRSKVDISTPADKQSLFLGTIPLSEVVKS